MSANEFPRLIDVRQTGMRTVRLVAESAERAALARRFGIVAIERLEADLELDRDGEAVNATGTLVADIVQSCAVSAEDLAVAVREPIAFRFVPGVDSSAHQADHEVELAPDELDEIEFTGTDIDLGEAVAQSLALAIDPFATGPDAEESRRRAGLLGTEDLSPFAALKSLKLGK